VIESSPHESRRILEFLVAIQVAVFVVGVSWAFGGNADWVRTPISLWGSLGIALTAVIIALRDPRQVGAGTFLWLVPIAALNVLVLVSCLTPGFKVLAYGNETYLMPIKIPFWKPSAAVPGLAAKELWLFDGIYFSCANIALAVANRKLIRIVLAAAVGNALALSIFGTVQKLVGSTGIYFGSVKSPQDYFFASFVYDNHWGAFIILMSGACFGLVLRYLSGPKGGGLFRGPAFVGIVAAFLIAISVPLSGARTCTLLLGILTGVALVKGISTASAALRQSGVSPVGAKIGIAVVVVLAAWTTWEIDGDVIQSRVSKAKLQISSAWAEGGLGARSILYHDTWRMARDRPLFGWGMASYPSVFPLYNTQVPKGDRIPVVYHDAHSDWLQSVSEIGFVGTIFIGIAVLLPALSVRKLSISPLPHFLLLGCGLVAAYAWVEFPFGNVAVVLAWWLCFICAIQYVRLSGLRTAKLPSD
jgi:O-antigen ligase